MKTVLNDLGSKWNFCIWLVLSKSTLQLFNVMIVMSWQNMRNWVSDIPFLHIPTHARECKKEGVEEKRCISLAHFLTEPHKSWHAEVQNHDRSPCSVYNKRLAFGQTALKRNWFLLLKPVYSYFPFPCFVTIFTFMNNPYVISNRL